MTELFHGGALFHFSTFWVYLDYQALHCSVDLSSQAIGMRGLCDTAKSARAIDCKDGSRFPYYPSKQEVRALLPTTVPGLQLHNICYCCRLICCLCSRRGSSSMCSSARPPAFRCLNTAESCAAADYTVRQGLANMGKYFVVWARCVINAGSIW